MTALEQPLHHDRTHPAEADHANLHDKDSAVKQITRC
jgi:hypothetical protein